MFIRRSTITVDSLTNNILYLVANARGPRLLERFTIDVGTMFSNFHSLSPPLSSSVRTCTSQASAVIPPTREKNYGVLGQGSAKLKKSHTLRTMFRFWSSAATLGKARRLEIFGWRKFATTRQCCAELQTRHDIGRSRWLCFLGTGTSLATDFPLKVAPGIISCGPIVLPVTPLATLDPELYE